MKLQILPLWTRFPVAESIGSTKADSLAYWTVFLEIVYSHCISPFRIKWNPDKKSWAFVTNQRHKVLVGILTVVYLLNYGITTLHQDFGSTTDSIFYFRVAEFIVGLLYGALHYIVWTKQDLIKHIYAEVQLRNCLKTSYQASGGLFRRTKESWVRIFANVYQLQSLFGLMETFSVNQWDFSTILQTYEETAVEYFHLPESTSTFIALPIGIVIFVLEVYTAYAECALELFFLMTILFFRELVEATVREIQDVSPGASPASYQAVLNTYRSLKEMVHSINEVCGPVTLVFVFGAMVYLCQMLIGFTRAKSMIIFFRDFMFLVWVVLDLYLAADAHRKAGGIYKWLYLKINYQNYSQIELTTLLHDLALNDIGIGVDSCFTITFNFLGLVLGVVVSYTLIFYQLQAVSSSPVSTIY